MAMSVIEITKKYGRLIQLGNLFGFNVKEKDRCIEWNDHCGNVYCIIPCISDQDISEQIDSLGEVVVLVDLENKKVLSSERCRTTTLFEMEKMSDALAAGFLTKEQICNIWNVLFSRTSIGISDMLELVVCENDKGPEVCREGVAIAKESVIRTPKVTASSPDSFVNLINQTRSKRYSSIEKKMYVDVAEDSMVLQLVSKKYSRKLYDEYWYSVHAYQIEEMNKHLSGYYSFGFSEQQRVVLIEKKCFDELIPILTVSPNNGDPYWHVKIHTNVTGDFYKIKTKKGTADIDATVLNGVVIIDRVNTVEQDKKMIKLSMGELREVTVRKGKR